MYNTAKSLKLRKEEARLPAATVVRLAFFMRAIHLYPVLFARHGHTLNKTNGKPLTDIVFVLYADSNSDLLQVGRLEVTSDDIFFESIEVPAGTTATPEYLFVYAYKDTAEAVKYAVLTDEMAPLSEHCICRPMRRCKENTKPYKCTKTRLT